MNIHIGVLYFGGGTPEPYSINDLLRHVGQGAEFYYSDGSLNAQHYIIINPSFAHSGLDPEDVFELIKSADDIVNEAKHYAVGEIPVGNSGIHSIDVDAYDNEGVVSFTLEGNQDIRLIVKWRD